MYSDLASMLMSRICLTGEGCARVLGVDAKDLHPDHDMFMLMLRRPGATRS